MSKKHPKINQTMRKRRNERKGVKHTMKHLSINIVGRSISPKQKMGVGSWRKKILPPIQLEVIKKHLKVCGAHNRIKDLATGKSDII
jgi:hypothetical protein